jgi:hypothetical protein
MWICKLKIQPVSSVLHALFPYLKLRLSPIEKARQSDYYLNNFQHPLSAYKALPRIGNNKSRHIHLIVATVKITRMKNVQEVKHEIFR